ncbi:MAG: hypothetical protein EHM35_07760 [Planctomycetaceae bacterium]|nr:MAG: hypothetical protein EHM35_07760 [Planctomycetaceae bacterium]
MIHTAYKATGRWLHNGMCRARTCALGIIGPEAVAACRYRRVAGHALDLNAPKDFNAKIQWLKFRSDTSRWAELADKVRVRGYVRDCGYASILNEVLAVYSRATDIDFSALPSSFVLKANNASAAIILVKDKRALDMADTRRQLEHWLRTPFGVVTAEPYYRRMTPRILAERYLEQDGGLSTSLIDYKFHCFQGEPAFCLVLCNRVIGGHVSKVVYDLDWNKHNEYLVEGERTGIDIPKPRSYATMLEIARDLSRPFPFVRVDLYEVEGRPIFGELTFTPAAGFITYYTHDFLNILGDMLRLPDE